MKHKKIKAVPLETTWSVYVHYQSDNYPEPPRVADVLVRRVEHVLVTGDGWSGSCTAVEEGGYMSLEEEDYWEFEGLITAENSQDAWAEGCRLVGFAGAPGEPCPVTESDT